MRGRRMTRMLPSSAFSSGSRTGLEVAVSVTQGADRLAAVANGSPLTVADALHELGWSRTPFSGELDDGAVTHLHLGNEFCERLLPGVEQLQQDLTACADSGLQAVFATPMVTDRGLIQLRRLLRQLPDATEVVANDLGVLRLLHREYPELKPCAGRQLGKMIKDPRLPSADWVQMYPSGIDGHPFRSLLQRFGVMRLETDVAPFAMPESLRGGDLPLSVHAPYGYSVLGRTCRIGSLHLAAADKFAPGHGCRRECLDYMGCMRRPAAQGSADLPTFQRGNTIFYRHSPTMTRSLRVAVERGWIGRLVISGDWNEDHRAG